MQKDLRFRELKKRRETSRWIVEQSLKISMPLYEMSRKSEYLFEIFIWTNVVTLFLEKLIIIKLKLKSFWYG